MRAAAVAAALAALSGSGCAGCSPCVERPAREAPDATLASGNTVHRPPAVESAALGRRVRGEVP